MRRLQLRYTSWTSAALLLVGLYVPARAQDPDDLKRGVGRISLMNGQVSVQRGDSGDWVAGIINAPLISGDRIATGPNTRAEIQFDSSHLIRLGGNAEVHLTQIESGHYQMEFARGMMTYRVLRPSDAYVEVDTPNVSVHPARVGVYRISVTENGETEVTARAGEVEVYSPRGSQMVNAGQTMIARGDPQDPEYQIVAAVGLDDWDRWNDQRDRTLTQSRSEQYVGPGIYGAEDLDSSGTWTNVEGYGYCWHPQVAVDWAPYRYGRWSWLDWYGWTWVPEDSWGWAPYHYGRWFYEANYGWMWYPGLHGVRHYWSPALVAFFGFGGGGGFGVGVGFGFGHVGWVPLAPYEVFHPWWGRGYYGGLNRNINITNINITNVYRNARVAHGVSSVGAEDFRAGRFGGITHPNGEQLRTAGLVRGQIGITPSRGNLNYSEHGAAYTPRTSGQGRFFTHQQPSAAPRVSFAQQQGGGAQGVRGMGASSGAGNSSPARAGGFNSGAYNNDRPSASAQGGAQGGAMNRTIGGSGSAAGGNSNGGFRRFGDPGGQASSQTNAAPRTESGWRNNSPATQNTRPQQGVQPQGSQAQGQSQGNSGNTRHFGSPGNSPTPSYGGSQSGGSYSPQQQRPSYGGSQGGGSYSPQQQRPSYGGSQGGGSYSPPPQRPSYGGSGGGSSAPQHQSAPSYSPPPSHSGGGGGGGGGNSRPAGGGGGGSSSHSSGSGGRHR